MVSFPVQQEGARCITGCVGHRRLPSVSNRNCTALWHVCGGHTKRRQKMHALAWAQYDAHSTRFFETYESLEFRSMHRVFLRFLPQEGGRCLDVGAGSGRDAAALARMGYRVTAVEPSTGLRTLAEKYHNGLSIAWLDDSLPALNKVKMQGEQYAFILLSAVWMHIPPDDRPESLRTLAELLAPQGRLAITLRLGSPDPNRIMFPVSSRELVSQAAAVGLKPCYLGRPSRDSLRRGSVRWVRVVLSR
ncbi:class I SAM-dependent methyltransferase [Burkholderia cenocepacia]|uniref:class I SAM-dependent methyltransferase n=1 Tax=Burkholderia cenocepacia TaxID=95486 RepID=UPI0038736F4E